MKRLSMKSSVMFEYVFEEHNARVEGVVLSKTGEQEERLSKLLSVCTTETRV